MKSTEAKANHDLKKKKTPRQKAKANEKPNAQD
jgi:hypothetical protein